MKLNLIGPFVVNAPFGTEIAFAKGLRRIGHEVVEVDPNVDPLMSLIDPNADATVVFKTCCGSEKRLTDLRLAHHPVVVYQPDDARFPHIEKMIAMMRRYSDLFLSFDDHGATIAKRMGYRAAETLLLTADDELYCPSPEPIERDIDVSFIGSLGDSGSHASRHKMIEIVKEHGEKRKWNMVFGSTQDTSKIVDVYRRSKVVLNHATDVGQGFGGGYGLQCRHFEVGMTGAALLSNRLLNFDVSPLPFMAFSSKEDLLSMLEYMLNGRVWGDPGNVWETIGRNLYGSIMAAHRPEHRAAQLVDFIQRNS